MSNEPQNDSLVGALRAAASAGTPAFSESLHSRVMAEVRQGGAAREPFAWRRLALAAAALIAVVGGVVVWRAQTEDVQKTPIVKVTPPSLPDGYFARGASAARQQIDAFVESQQLASLDRDAARLAGFVIEQLDVVPVDPKAR
jgi:hypothetical protein